MRAFLRRARPGAIAVIFLLTGICFPAAEAAGDTSGWPVSGTAPDLVIDGVTWQPQTPLVGSTVTFTAAIRNQGKSQADASLLAFYLDDTSLGTVTVGPIAAGATARPVFTWKAEAGSHNIRATADASNRIEESDETNNSRAVALAVPAPDLAVRDIVWSPASPSADDIVTFNVTITNWGNHRAGVFNVGFYVDSNSRGTRDIPGLEAYHSKTLTYIWKAQAGSHTISAAADIYHQVKEAGEDNNDRTIVYSTAPPDLIIRDITWSPASPTVGDNVTVTVRIGNQGTGKAGASWAANYVNDVHQSSVFIGEIEPGGTATEKFNWIAADGPHRFKTVADVDNCLMESDKTNNTQTVDLPSPLPDLIIQSITPSTTTPLTGQFVRFTISVKNQGKSPAGPSCIHFYCDGTRYKMYIGYLEAGDIAIATTIWPARYGPHTFRAAADAESLVNESDKANNEKTISIDFSTPPLPDFTVQDVAWSPATPSSGETVTLTATVKNQGSAAAGSSRLACYIDGVFYTSCHVDRISAGGTTTAVFSWKALPGSHTIRIIANSNYTVYESNKNNNSLTIEITAPAPDLIIQEITGLPPSPVTGDPVVFTVTVKNQGTLPAGGSYVAYYIDGVFAGFHDVPEIAAGGAVTRTFYWIARSGSHRFKATADDRNGVLESNELNNDKVIVFPAAS